MAYAKAHPLGDIHDFPAYDPRCIYCRYALKELERNQMSEADPFREPAEKFYLAEARKCYAAKKQIDMPDLLARAMRIAAEETLICYDFGPTLEEVASRISERIQKQTP
jgi:hypothetical protein